MKAAIYMRVSTKKQEIDSQDHAISMFCKSKPDKTYLTFTDLYKSGRKASRPGLNKLLYAVKQGEVNEVIVFKLDRLFRSLTDLLATLALFKRHDVNFISVSENIDLSTPAGILMMQMLGAFAEFERSIIVGRVKAGLAAAKDRGQSLGKPSKIPIEVQRQVVSLKESGKSYREVSALTGIKIPAIQRILLRKERIAFIFENKAKVI